ncbi:protease inhibitor I42 family protein [Paenibacillus campi]|uniref:protease inhibitor I42 family protein n=1 Tax=Paenibacillus campi TaxID=3106031 RepID=UPI002AFF7FF2|nr:protease inhibitor I42 family protein [Paenibacillus sp. SGZ-1009]
MKQNANEQSTASHARRQGWKGIAITAGCVALLGTGVGGGMIYAASDVAPYTYVVSSVTTTPIDPQQFGQMTEGASAVNESKVTNKTIAANTDATFNIKLQQNESTGYSWSYKADSHIQFVNKTETSPIPADVDKKDVPIVGAPNDTILTFKADKPGTYKLTFDYVRAWEKDAKPAETVIYTIKVNDKKAADQANVSNKKIEATAGKTFDIKLEQNDSTGYTWNYKAEPQLKLVKASEQATASSSKSKDGETIVGAPTNKTWVFQADKPGTYKLTFKYERAWEKGVKPAQTVVYTVHVK